MVIITNQIIFKIMITLPIRIEEKLENKFGENYFLKVMIISLIGLIPLVSINYFDIIKYEFPTVIVFLFEIIGYSLAISSIGLFAALIFSIPIYIIVKPIYKILSFFITKEKRNRIEKSLTSTMYITYLSFKFTVFVLLFLYVIYGLFFGEVKIINEFFKYALIGQFTILTLICVILDEYS